MPYHPECSLIQTPVLGGLHLKKKKKMTKAERAAAAQEGVSAFEVEPLQKECISLKDAPQDRDCCHVGALNIDFPVWKT